MKRLLLIFILTVAAASASFSQDIIYKKNGDEIKAKVNKIGSEEIEYYRFDNLTGPLFTIAKSEVLIIIYSNGSKDIFQEAPSSNNVPVTNNVDVRPPSRYRASDIFNKTSTLVWYGVDYSKVKLTNLVLENTGNIFTDINNLIISEKKRYDYNIAVRKPIMSADLNAVEKANAQIDFSLLQSGTANTITWTDLQGIIDKYTEFEGVKDGIGMVLVAENLVKTGTSGSGSYFVLFFDIATKNILLSDKVSGYAGGSSQRNFWARTVLESINKIRDIKYTQWKLANRS